MGHMMCDDLEIPDFLKRDKGDTAPKGDDNATVPAVDPEKDKWRAMEKQRSDSRKARSRARVARMMAVKADREALASGKRWNTIKGRWE